MEERRRAMDCILDKIETKIESIEKMLKGNGTMGVAEMARRAFDRTEESRLSKNGKLDWAYRYAIGILLTFIAIKVGLK